VVLGGGDAGQPVARHGGGHKPAAAAGTTSLTVTKYDAHGTVLSTQTITYLQMEASLPVQGDATVALLRPGPHVTNTSFQCRMEPY